MLRCVYLEVTLLNGQNYSIPVEEGHSVEEELELFLSRDGRYAGAGFRYKRRAEGSSCAMSRSSLSVRWA